MLDDSDHRAIGARMDLFHFQEEAPGSAFWHPRGWILFQLVESYIRDCVVAQGYQEVKTPQLIARSLWEGSGHWENFRGGMMAFSDDERELALKPVNCPGHVQIFKRAVLSYRDLPFRIAEFGACHRNEPSGSLLGLKRVRAFTQDDGHVFCREDQVNDEIAAFCRSLDAAYAAFGFGAVEVKLSTRPAERAGTDEVWDRAEAALAEAARAAGIAYELQPGEGAFYGPKLEFALRDSHGRAWQCGTIQLDLVIPERLDASYVAPSGGRARPVMLHRAILGSLERFVAILLEHHRGALPVWLAPEQVVVATIAEAHREYGARVLAALRGRGIRASLDDRPETINRKVAEAHQAGVPFLWTVGGREAASGAVSVREKGGAQQNLPLEAALAAIEKAAARPAIPVRERL